MPAEGNHPTRFDVIVNHQTISNKDPVLKGRDILELSGHRPAVEHVLLKRSDDGMLEETNPERDIDLRKAGAETFYAFRADRLFYFSVDERRFPWGAPAISESDLREIARIGDDRQLRLERRDEPDVLIAPGTSVKLDGPCVEHLYTVETTECDEVELNGEMVALKSGKYTTETLKAALGVDAHWDLDVFEDGILRQLQPGEIIAAICGLKLVSHVRQGGSS